jgi:iron complex transport system permease protein
MKLPVASPGRLLLVMAALLLVVAGLSLCVGRYPARIFAWPASLAGDELGRRLLLNVRLPRILTAVLLGMSLAGAGTSFQMVFSNPLVEPGFLGVSQGAALGATCAISFLGRDPWAVQVSAMLFAFLGLALSYVLASRIRYGTEVLRLVLAGIAVSAMFASGLSVLKYIADPVRQLPEITYWMLGGLWNVGWPEFRFILPLVVASLVVLQLMRWRLNLLVLADETASSLGVSPGRERAIVLAAAVTATATVTAVSGIVSWVGLIIPHVARRLFGVDARHSLPGACLIGGLFTLGCDDIARSLLGGEIPLGILTSLVGALFFLVLMTRTGARRQEG